MTGIEWTDCTWNPTTGCTKISPGCKHCYAEAMAKRLHGMGKPKYRNVFQYTEHVDALQLPLHWRKPRRVFVNSMSDLFHEQATISFVRQVFDVMREASQHTYQVLTKRPTSMAKFSTEYDIPDHVWMGTSIEDRARMFRLEDLLGVRCKTRFISFEPLLGDVGELDLDGIHWCIIGGESGLGYRPISKDWVYNIIRQCKDCNVPVHFKQWGGLHPKSGGRLVDGVLYDEYPNP